MKRLYIMVLLSFSLSPCYCQMLSLDNLKFILRGDPDKAWLMLFNKDFAQTGARVWGNDGVIKTYSKDLKGSEYDQFVSIGQYWIIDNLKHYTVHYFHHNYYYMQIIVDNLKNSDMVLKKTTEDADGTRFNFENNDYYLDLEIVKDYTKKPYCITIVDKIPKGAVVKSTP